MTQITVTQSYGVIPEITISGPRQCGKTEMMINLVAGGILAGGSPVIMARNGETSVVQDRLARRLQDLGVSSPRATAKQHVQCRSSNGAGRGFRGPQYFEEDWQF